MSKIMFHLNSLAQGGAERVASNLANEFVKLGDEVVFATEWSTDDEFWVDERVRRVHVGFKPEDERKGRLTKATLRLKYLKEAMKTEKPDVVLAFTRKPIYRALFAGLGLKTPIIICVRTVPETHYDHPIDKIVIPLIKNRADGAVFQTSGQRDFFPKRWRDISTIIINPVKDKYFEAAKKEFTKTKTVMHHARIVDFKNQPMLIDAFMKVHSKYPEYDLKIYGPDSKDGTLKILQNKIKDYKAEDFIHLMGGSDELEKQIPTGEIYAFTSDWEGLPNSVIEAMAMGMPIVATDCPCGGPADVIKDHVNGLLVPIKDTEAVAEGMLYLIEHKEEAAAFGREATKIYERTNSEVIIKQWRDYIDLVISRKTK